MALINKIIAWLAANPIITSAIAIVLITELQALLLKYKGNAFVSLMISALINWLKKFTQKS